MPRSTPSPSAYIHISTEFRVKLWLNFFLNRLHKIDPCCDGVYCDGVFSSASEGDSLEEFSANATWPLTQLVFFKVTFTVIALLISYLWTGIPKCAAIQSTFATCINFLEGGIINETLLVETDFDSDATQTKSLQSAMTHQIVVALI